MFIVPEAPESLKALVMSTESVLVSWKPPAEPNGEINQYTVYIRPSGDNKDVGLNICCVSKHLSYINSVLDCRKNRWRTKLLPIK